MGILMGPEKPSAVLEFWHLHAMKVCFHLEMWVTCVYEFKTSYHSSRWTWEDSNDFHLKINESGNCWHAHRTLQVTPSCLTKDAHISHVLTLICLGHPQSHIHKFMCTWSIAYMFTHKTHKHTCSLIHPCLHTHTIITYTHTCIYMHTYIEQITHSSTVVYTNAHLHVHLSSNTQTMLRYHTPQTWPVASVLLHVLWSYSACATCTTVLCL